MSSPPDRTGPSDEDEAAGAAIATLVAAQAAHRALVTRQAVAMATAAAQSFTGWYDTAQIGAWAATLAARIEALQRNLAGSTDAYLARALSQLLGRRIRPIGVIDVDTLREGVTHAGAYGRAADVYRWQQAQLDAFTRRLVTAEDLVEPPDLIDPIDAAVQRVANVADVDMQLADRAQSRTVLQQHAERHDITGYRRVIHPERSKGGTCGLCIAASDRVYHVKELRPIHSRCECTTLPIVGRVDPGAGLNALDLRDLYKRAGGSTGSAALKSTRYQIDEHGELGPVLNPAGAKVRTERQAARETNPDRGRAKTPQQRAAQAARIHDSLAKALPKARGLAESDPMKWDGYLTTLEARIRDLESQLAA